jgi:hypothetical protein
MEGYPDDTLVPGDPNPVTKFYGDAKPAYPTVAWPPEGVSVDVPNVVTNWLRGEENGGYENYGFVFRGYAEGDLQFKDADACVSRFGYFTLTVKYRYDKESAAPDTYPIICRGIDTFKVIDTVGPAGAKGVGFTFTLGTSKAKDGLSTGQCSWVDRGMRPGEPGRLSQASESAGDWTKELSSSDSYWKFNVYNAGDQLQATSAERVSKPSTDVGKPSPAPGGGTLDTRKNVALALYGASADAQNFTQDGVAGPGLFFEPSFAIDGVLHTTSAGGNYWRDEHGLPSYLEVDFHRLRTIDEIDVITIQVPGYETGVDPSESDPKSFSSQGAENFEVKYLVGTEWKTVPNGLIVGNNRAFVKITFLPIAKTIKTSKIRVYVTKSAGPGGGDGIARIVELQAWGS